MLDYRKAEAGAADLARTGTVGAIKSLEYAL
jgi:hypothetical protein